jgi:hypothetical protein
MNTNSSAPTAHSAFPISATAFITNSVAPP